MCRVGPLTFKSLRNLKYLKINQSFRYKFKLSNGKLNLCLVSNRAVNIKRKKSSVTLIFDSLITDRPKLQSLKSTHII